MESGKNKGLAVHKGDNIVHEGHDVVHKGHDVVDRPDDSWIRGSTAASASSMSPS